MAATNAMSHTPAATHDQAAWQYLQAELAYIDLLVQRAVRCWVLAGQDPNDDYRGLYVTQSEVEQLLAHPIGVSWGQTITLPDAEASAFTEALARARQQANRLADHLATQGQAPRLHQLATAFDLDRTALDLFLLALAPALDTRYERLYGYLQDNVMRRRPTVRLLLDLVGEPGIGKFTLLAYLTQDAPLFQYRLLEYITEAPPNNMHWINQTVQVDEGVVAWLLGHYQPHSELQGHVTLTNPTDCELDRLLVGNTTLAQIQAAAELLQAAHSGLPHSLFVFTGIDGAAQDATARWLANQWQRPLLTVTLTGLGEEKGPPQQAVRLALREARLTGALLYLTGWDACLDEARQAPRAVLAVLSDQPGVVIVAGRTPWSLGGLNDTRAIDCFDFPAPTYDVRRRLWEHLVAAVQLPPQSINVTTDQGKTQPDAAQAMATFDWDLLAGHFALTGDQIRTVVMTAQNQARQAGRLLTNADLLAAARNQATPRLGMLATKIVLRYGWTDLILPADQLALLHELAATVRQRAKVLEQWGLGKKLAASAGVSALFAGPPGTGKTMAAEVIAGVLGLDLYKIDLSTVVSKYIGETEKNLERIFSEATSSNAILFFDEADALFGKRSEVKDAHDRFANIEISYLLQRMERYDGVAILATNLRANLDEAFTRRLHFIVAFPFPQRAERLRIWEALRPPELPLAPDVDFAKLAHRFELAGGNIRNVLYSAAHLAATDGQVVTMAHLLHGVKRELQKMGRMVGVE